MIRFASTSTMPPESYVPHAASPATGAAPQETDAREFALAYALVRRAVFEALAAGLRRGDERVT